MKLMTSLTTKNVTGMKLKLITMKKSKIS